MLTYRGKNYEFSEMDGTIVIPDESLTTLPKAVLLLLLAGAARGSFNLADTTRATLSAKMGKYLDNGQLNSEGARIFRKDKEVLATLRSSPSITNSQAENLGDVGSSDSLQVLIHPAPAPASQTTSALLVARDVETGGRTSHKQATVTGMPDLASLLDLICEFLGRFMVLSDPSHKVVLALWIAHTWVIEAFRYTPYLFVYSPVLGCGKSRFLECLGVLVRDYCPTASATEAVLMRQITQLSPTLFFDEIDTIFKSSSDKSREGLRALLNVGFTRGTTISRCSGRAVVDYSVFCPKVFAGIGDCLPATVRDRSIKIHLIRRRKDEPIDSLRHPDFAAISAEIVAELTAWAGDEEIVQRLAAARPQIPAQLGDRAADIGEPLLAIAEMAGGEWPEAAQSALVSLSPSEDHDRSPDPAIRLLAAIRDIFAEQGKRQLPTILILQQLAARDEEEEWTMRWPREIASSNARGPAARLAGLLRPFSISAGTIRLADGSTPKGYRMEAFLDAFARYLPPLVEKDATTPHQSGTGSPETQTNGNELGHGNPQI